MAAFDYLAVIVSIVLGLGITQILSGFAGWLTERKTVRLYPPAVIWAISLLLVHLQTWWSMYGLRYWQEWNFLQFTFVILQPILLYLLSVLVLPGPAQPQRDMKSSYAENRNWFFGCFLLLLVISIIKDLVRQGSLPEPANLGFHGLLFILGILALTSRKDYWNLAVAIAVLVLLVAYVVLLFAQLA